MIISQLIVWTFIITWVVLVVLSGVLGYHIYSDTRETEAYTKTGRMRVRIAITATLAISSAIAGITAGSLNASSNLWDYEAGYWANLAPWILLSVITFAWWIAHLNHIYKVVRVEEAGVLTAVDNALKIRFPVTAEQLKQLEASFE